MIGWSTKQLMNGTPHQTPDFFWEGSVDFFIFGCTTPFKEIHYDSVRFRYKKPCITTMNLSELRQASTLGTVINHIGKPTVAFPNREMLSYLIYVCPSYSVQPSSVKIELSKLKP